MVGLLLAEKNKKRYKVEEKKHREMEQVRSLIQRVCLPLRYLPGGVPPPAVGISSFSYTNVPLYTDNSINDFSNYKSTVWSPRFSISVFNAHIFPFSPGCCLVRRTSVQTHHTIPRV